MSLTLITLNHSVMPNFWQPCLSRLENHNSLIKFYEINICDYWSKNSTFDWWIQLDDLLNQESPTHLVIIAADLGAVLLKSWLEENQKLASEVSIDAIFLDSPSFEDWLEIRYTEELSQMDRAQYVKHLQNNMQKQGAPEEWMQALSLHANFLKALIVRIHEILEQRSDESLWLPRLESWHEIISVTPPIPLGFIHNESQKNIANWLTKEFVFSQNHAIPSTETATKIQTILFNILSDIN